MVPHKLPRDMKDVYCMAICQPMGDEPITRIAYDKKAPVILEPRAAKDEATMATLAQTGATLISKADSRNPDPQYKVIAADMLLIVLRDGAAEPSALFVMRDPNAPGGARLCCPGGWSGPEGPAQTALQKINEEIAVLQPDGERLSMTEAFSRFSSKTVGDVLSDVRIDYLDDDGAVTSSEQVHCRPFFHGRYLPGIGDDNHVNLLSVRAIKLPREAKLVDITNFNRTVHEVGLSQVPEFLNGQAILPTVAFVRDELLLELRRSRDLKEFLTFEHPTIAAKGLDL